MPLRRRLLAVLVLSLASLRSSAQPAAGEPDKLLERFVGVWNVQVTAKPAQWLPNGGKFTVQESTAWTLKKRFILGREMSQPDGVKRLWLQTLDPASGEYVFRMWDSAGLMGGQWSSTWDEASKTLTGKAADTPQGWTSQGISRFPDRSAQQTTVWMKDETGRLLMDQEMTKSRQPDGSDQKMLAAWSKTDALPAGAPALPPQLKALERLIGTWDVVAVARVAEWTPQETRTTGKIVRQWVLDGRFIQDTAQYADDTESLSLYSYDEQAKAYRSWWFSSLEYNNKSTGQWDAATGTFSFTADVGNGLTSTSTMRFAGEGDQHTATAIVKDGGGKVYFDGQWTVTRRDKLAK
jgi:hypothetical protein